MRVCVTTAHGAEPFAVQRWQEFSDRKKSGRPLHRLRAEDSFVDVHNLRERGQRTPVRFHRRLYEGTEVKGQVGSCLVNVRESVSGPRRVGVR